MIPGQDTVDGAAQVWTDVFRAMPVHRKWRLLDEAFATGKALHRAGVLSSNPRSSAASVQRAWLKTNYHLEVSGELTMSEETGRLDVLQEVVAVLTRLDIPYALGGSMASSIHGITRFTLDADLTVEPFPGKEEALANSFGKEYYVSLAAIKDAVKAHASFNIIHTLAGFKVDIFVRKDDPFEQSALARRIYVTVTDGGEKPIAVLAPEDVILFKLQWYRLGQEVSKQQLDDVLGILQTKAGQLDEGYLSRWAASLKVDDLLKRLRDQRT